MCRTVLTHSVFLPGHTVVFADQSGMNASGHVMLGTMDVHHQWTKVMQLRLSCCRVQSLCCLLFSDPCCVPPAFWAAARLSQPAATDTLAEGEDQPPPGWNPSGAHGQTGTSSAHSWALQFPKHLPQTSNVPPPSSTPQESAGPHHVAGKVRNPFNHWASQARAVYLMVMFVSLQWPL